MFANIKHLPCWSSQCSRSHEWKRWASCYNCSSILNQSSHTMDFPAPSLPAQFRGPPESPCVVWRGSVNHCCFSYSFWLKYHLNVVIIRYVIFTYLFYMTSKFSLCLLIWSWSALSICLQTQGPFTQNAILLLKKREMWTVVWGVKS